MRDRFHWDDMVLEAIRASSQKRIRSTELQNISAELIARSRETIVYSRKFIARISKSLPD